MNNQFIDLCKNGKFDEVKELYQNNKIYFNAIDDAFVLSCANGHLNIAQWLYSLDGVNMNVREAFRWSCCNGYLNIMQWIYSLGNVNIHDYNQVFIWSCCGNHINIIQWLLSIKKFNNNIVDEYLPIQLHDYAFNQGYLPTNKMKPTYVKYKNKIRNEISIFEIDDLTNIIVAYI